jgi:hypothetical protein
MAWTFTGWTHETPTIRSKSKGYYEFTETFQSTMIFYYNKKV